MNSSSNEMTPMQALELLFNATAKARLELNDHKMCEKAAIIISKVLAPPVKDENVKNIKGEV